MKECRVCAAAAAAAAASAAWASANGPEHKPVQSVVVANGAVNGTPYIYNCAGTSGGDNSQLPGVTGVTRRGKCKWFNVAKGWGFITPIDGGLDIFVHQSVIQMQGFRSLGDDEEVEFECKVSDKGLEATRVTGPASNDCQGSNRRPTNKKRFRKIRCYNCGEFANHIAAKCSMEPQPKRCHNCKSEDHLIADCPKKVEKRKDDQSKSSGSSGSQQSSPHS